MGYVDRFIKNINLENTKQKETKLQALLPGDIIWAKRYSKEEIRQNIDLEHQESPFIVIYKNELNIVYCLECSSNKNYGTNIVMFKRNNYNGILFKDTYVKLKSDVEMTNYRYIRKLGKLKKEDFNLLKKKLYLAMRDDKISSIFSFEKNILNFYTDSGDVLMDNNGAHYLIGSKTNNHTIGYILERDDIDYDFKINDKSYKIRFDKRKNLQLKFSTLFFIYHKFEDYSQQSNQTGYFWAKIGNLIRIGNTLYLVHGKYKKYYVIIRIYNNKDKVTDTYDIYISNIKYTTKFEFFLIPSEYEYEIVSNILEFEICEYMYKLSKYNIKLNLSKDNILDIDNSTNINLSKFQMEIVKTLEQKNFDFNEIASIMVSLKEQNSQLLFNDYLIKNYKEKDKEIIKNVVYNIYTYADYNKPFLKKGDIIIANRQNDPHFKNTNYELTGIYFVLHVDEENRIYAVAGHMGHKNTTKQEVKLFIKEVVNDGIKTELPAYPIEIKRDDYVEKIGELSLEKLNKITKKVYANLYFSESNNSLSKENLIYYNTPLDIIKYNNGYHLILDVNDNYFYTCSVKKNDKVTNFRINNISYTVDLKKFEKIANKKYEVVRILNENKFNKIKNNKKWKDIQLPVLSKIEQTLKYADIIEYNNNYYLIFGEYKNYFKLYNLYTSKKGLYSFTNDNVIYTTNFEVCLISKDTNVKVISTLSPSKFEEINTERKNLITLSESFKKPIDIKDLKDLTLNFGQIQIIEKLKNYNFSNFELIGTLIALNNKFYIDEMLDFIIKKEQSEHLNKYKIIQELLKILRN